MVIKCVMKGINEDLFDRIVMEFYNTIESLKKIQDMVYKINQQVLDNYKCSINDSLFLKKEELDDMFDIITKRFYSYFNYLIKVKGEYQDFSDNVNINLKNNMYNLDNYMGKE